MTNTIEEINKTFFGKDKAKEYVTDDLETCIERLIQQQIVDHTLIAALNEYEDNHHYPSGVVEHDGKKYQVTSVGISDPKHARALAVLQRSCMDATMLGLRSLFTNNERKDSTSGGAFLRALHNLPDLEAVIQEHRRTIPSRTEQDIVHDSKLVSELETKLEMLYDRLYRRSDGGYDSNYRLLWEYQRDNFHKDHWLEGKKFEIERTTESDEMFSSKTIYHKKHKYRIQPYELHELLNDFAEIVLLYAQLCIFPSAEGQLAPSLRNGTSLKTMLKEYDVIYANRLAESEQQEIIDILKAKMPYGLQFLHLK